MSKTLYVDRTRTYTARVDSRSRPEIERNLERTSEVGRDRVAEENARLGRERNSDTRSRGVAQPRETRRREALRVEREDRVNSRLLRRDEIEEIRSLRQDERVRRFRLVDGGDARIVRVNIRLDDTLEFVIDYGNDETARSADRFTVRYERRSRDERRTRPSTDRRDDSIEFAINLEENAPATGQGTDRRGRKPTSSEGRERNHRPTKRVSKARRDSARLRGTRSNAGSQTPANGR